MENTAINLSFFDGCIIYHFMSNNLDSYLKIFDLHHPETSA